MSGTQFLRYISYYSSEYKLMCPEHNQKNQEQLLWQNSCQYITKVNTILISSVKFLTFYFYVGLEVYTHTRALHNVLQFTNSLKLLSKYSINVDTTMVYKQITIPVQEQQTQFGVQCTLSCPYMCMYVISL